MVDKNKKNNSVDIIDFINQLKIKSGNQIFAGFQTDVDKTTEKVILKRYCLYCHGGVLGKTPILNRRGSNFTLFDKKYVNYANEKISFKNLDWSNPDDDTRVKFYLDNISEIVKMMKNWANGSKKSNKEREQENFIAINNDNYVNEDSIVVSDMEFCVSFGKNKAKPDLVVYYKEKCKNKQQTKDTIGFVEYKSTKTGFGKNNSLRKHYDDMKKYVNNNDELAKSAKKQAVVRFNKLVDDKFIKNVNRIKGIANVNTKIIFLFSNLKEIKGYILKDLKELEDANDIGILFIEDKVEDKVEDKNWKLPNVTKIMDIKEAKEYLKTLG